MSERQTHLELKSFITRCHWQPLEVRRHVRAYLLSKGFTIEVSLCIDGKMKMIFNSIALHVNQC